MSKELDKSASSLKSLGANLQSLGTQMTAAFTVPLVAAGAAGVKLAIDLDKAMRNIQSITKQTDESLALLSDEFVKLSMDMSKTTDSAENLAQGYYQIISSGIDAADAMKVLEVATKAASAGLTTTEVAAKGIITVLNSYKLGVEDASRVSDILFETVNRGVGTFEELNASLSNVVPTASVMGISLEEVSAGLATLSKNGFSFSEASVAMNNAMNAFLKPSEAMSKALQEMGYSSGQAMIDALGFGGAMQKVQEYTGGSSEALAELFPEIRGFRAAAILAGQGADTFAEDLAAMSASTGATSAAFAEQMKSFDASWKNFQNTLNAALIDIGQTMMPILTGIMNFLTPIIQGFMALPEPIKQLIIVFGVLLAAIGPVMIIIAQLISAFTTISAIMPVVGAAFTAFLALGAPVIALIAAVIAAIVLLIANWEQLGTTMQQLGTIIDHSMGNIFSKSSTTLQQLAALVGHAWQEMLGKAGTALSQLGQIVMATLSKLGSIGFEIGKNIIGGLIKGFSHAMIQFIALVQQKVNEINQKIRNAFGIASPSKVMMKIGQQIVQGLHKGIENFGGIGVNVPSTGGSIQSRQPSLAVAGASSGGSGGSGNVYIENLTVPTGTTEEQIKHIMKEIGKEVARLGGKPTR